MTDPGSAQSPDGPTAEASQRGATSQSPGATPPYERFNKIAGGIQSIVTAIAIVVAGVWALWRFGVLLEARIATAEAEKAEAEAVMVARRARQTVVLSIDLSAQQIAKTSSTQAKWVLVEVSVKNGGNDDYKIDLTSNTKFYVARVEGVKPTGELTYANRLNLQFDYPDKTMEWFLLRPGAETDKLRTVQRISSPGLYIARFAVSAPNVKPADDAEFSAQTFFYVK